MHHQELKRNRRMGTRNNKKSDVFGEIYEVNFERGGPVRACESCEETSSEGIY